MSGIHRRSMSDHTEWTDGGRLRNQLIVDRAEKRLEFAVGTVEFGAE